MKLASARSISEYQASILKYFKRLVIPYLVWGSINFTIDVFKNLTGEVTIGLPQALIKQFYNWLMTEPGVALWYVQAILILLVILYFIKNKKQFHLLTGILFVAYVASQFVYDFADENIIASSIVNTYEKIFITNGNFIFNGIFFLSGIMLSRHRTQVQCLKNRRMLLLLMLAYAIYVVLMNIGGYCYILTPACVIAVAVLLFLTLYNIHITMTEGAARVLRKLSGIIYFTHYFAMSIVQLGFKFMGFKYADYNTLIWLICCFGLTVYALFVIEIDKEQKIIGKIY